MPSARGWGEDEGADVGICEIVAVTVLGAVGVDVVGSSLGVCDTDVRMNVPVSSTTGV
jgi:hypothetical protein